MIIANVAKSIPSVEAQTRHLHHFFSVMSELQGIGTATVRLPSTAASWGMIEERVRCLLGSVRDGRAALLTLRASCGQFSAAF